MEEKQKLEWEEIYSKQTIRGFKCTKRAKVYKGWLILHTTIFEGKDDSNHLMTESMQYISDPSYEWKLDDD
jgi:hypothetical protein